MQDYKPRRSGKGARKLLNQPLGKSAAKPFGARRSGRGQRETQGLGRRFIPLAHGSKVRGGATASRGNTVNKRPAAPEEGQGRRASTAGLGSRLGGVLLALVPAGLRLRHGVAALAMAWLVAGLADGAFALWNAPVAAITVQGALTLSREEVLATAGLAEGDSMAAADPYTLARRLVAHPRVLSADARRILPDRMLLTLHEREPRMRVVLSDGSEALVDADGTVLDIVLQSGAVGGRVVGGRVVGRQGVRAASPVASSPKANNSLPRILGSTVVRTGSARKDGGRADVAREAEAVAVLGQPIVSAAFDRARPALAALEALAFPVPGELTVEAGHPFLLTLSVEGGPELHMPYSLVEPALRRYKALAQASNGLLDGVHSVDFSQLRPDGGGRVVLARVGSK